MGREQASLAETEAFTLIAAARNGGAPIAMGEVPVDGGGEALGEGNLRLPAGQCLELGRLDGVAPVSYTHLTLPTIYSV